MLDTLSVWVISTADVQTEHTHRLELRLLEQPIREQHHFPEHYKLINTFFFTSLQFFVIDAITIVLE